MPRQAHQLNAEQLAALIAARQAQQRFAEAQQAVDRASDDRAASFRAALDAGLTYGQLADAFGWRRSTVQAAAAGRARKR